ncbi:MAG: hypothetical protein ACXAC5_22295 [Promethearchaeota archaeon]|jgi:hypothetical protein
MFAMYNLLVHGRSKNFVSWLLHFFLTSKPYSYSLNIAVSILVCGYAGKGVHYKHVISVSIVSILMWLFFNWYSDSSQKDRGRLVPPKLLIWSPLIITLVMSACQNILAIFFLLLHIAAIMLYPLKATRHMVGSLGPLIRGVTIFTQALFALAFIGGLPSITYDFVLMIIAISLLHVARNLIGDVRDIRQDRFEIPARFGFNVSLWIVRTVMIIISILTFFIKNGTFLIGLPLVIQWIGLEIIVLLISKENEHIIGYLAHRLFIFTVTSACILIAFFCGVSGKVCIILIALMLLLQPTYTYLPGKQFPTLQEIILSLKQNKIIKKRRCT